MCEASSDHWVTSDDLECPGAGEEVCTLYTSTVCTVHKLVLSQVRACNTGPCVPDMMALVPGARLLTGIVSGISSIFDPPQKSSPSSQTQQTQTQDHSCEYDCDGWPFQQCKVCFINSFLSMTS